VEAPRRRQKFQIKLSTEVEHFILAISGLFWGPMAVAIMGGLIVFTFLTLVVAPVLYAIFFNIKTSGRPEFRPEEEEILRI